MKRMVVLLLCTMVVSVAAAQSKEEQKILSQVEKLRQAMISGNRSELENVTSNDLSYWHSGGKFENKQQFVETIASKKSDFVTINLSEQTVKISGKIALVHHKLLAATNDGGKPATVNLGVLQVWQKEGHEWKLFARQAYKLDVPKP